MLFGRASGGRVGVGRGGVAGHPGVCCRRCGSGWDTCPRVHAEGEGSCSALAESSFVTLHPMRWWAGFPAPGRQAAVSPFWYRRVTHAFYPLAQSPGRSCPGRSRPSRTRYHALRERRCSLPPRERAAPGVSGDHIAGVRLIGCLRETRRSDDGAGADERDAKHRPTGLGMRPDIDVMRSVSGPIRSIVEFPVRELPVCCQSGAVAAGRASAAVMSDARSVFRVVGDPGGHAARA